MASADPSSPPEDPSRLLPNPDVRPKQQQQPQGGGGGGKKGKKGKKGKQTTAAAETEAETIGEEADLGASSVASGLFDEDAVRLSVALCQKVYQDAASVKNPEPVGPYPTLGLTPQDRKKAQKEIFPTLIHLECKEMTETMQRLWQLPEREYQHLVLDLLRHGTVTILRSSAQKDLFQLLKFLASTKPMRDTVDVLATKHLTTLAYLEPAETWPRMDDWILDSNPWVVRAAILHQHGMGDFTDRERLFRYCRRHLNPTPEFLPVLEDAMEEALQRFADTYQTQRNPSGLEQAIQELKTSLPKMGEGLKARMKVLLLKLMKESEERKRSK